MNSTLFKWLISLLMCCFVLLATISCEPPTEAKTTGRIEGVVYDASTLEPIGGVTITTEPITSSKITDTNGSFKIEGIEPGDYTLQAVRLEYHSNSTTIKVVADETTTADLQLIPLIPELSISATLLNFGTVSTNLTFTIRNTGIGVVTWNAVSTGDWVSVAPTHGTVEAESDVVTVTVNRNGKDPGNYYDKLTISSNHNSTTLDIMMTVLNPDAPQLSTHPISLDFGAHETESEFFISNTGSNTLTWTITDNKPWISTAQSSGTNEATVTVSIDRRDMTVGNYGGVIDVYSNGGHNQIDVYMEVSIYDPPTPVTLSDPANITSNTVDLTWSRNYDSDFNAYLIYYDTTENVTDQSFLSTTISDNNINYHTITGLNSNTTYYFKVYVKDNMEYISGSNQVSGTTLATNANWYLAGNITDVSCFNGVWFCSGNNGYAVGKDTNGYGVVYHSNGSTWVRELYTFPEELVGIRFNNVDDGFVWSRDKVYHFNGVNWEQLTTLPPSHSSLDRDVFPISTGDIWSADHLLEHWTGSTWTSISLPGGARAVHFTSTENGWVYNGGGYNDIRLYHYNGSGWALHSVFSVYSGYEVKFAFQNSNEGWLVENISQYAIYRLYHFNGTTWSLQQTFASQLNSIFPLTQTNVWTVSTSGRIYHYDGSSWNEEISPTSENLYGLYMISDTEGWAVGNNGVILRYH